MAGCTQAVTCKPILLPLGSGQTLQYFNYRVTVISSRFDW